MKIDRFMNNLTQLDASASGSFSLSASVEPEETASFSPEQCCKSWAMILRPGRAVSV